MNVLRMRLNVLFTGLLISMASVFTYGQATGNVDNATEIAPSTTLYNGTNGNSWANNNHRFQNVFPDKTNNSKNRKNAVTNPFHQVYTIVYPASLKK